ncbi:hypothetical protein [uncultured Methylobacterium sp.]|nr:hypothetical protein [uncultured Methylobacterium sp.]
MAALVAAVAGAGWPVLRAAIARDACLDAGGVWHSPGGAWYAGTCRR